MSAGTVGVLNVGAGELELSFDPKNPSERIRAARVIRDMMRRGYALLVEVERDGEKRFERALDFDDTHYRWIIADFDPVTAALSDAGQKAEEELDRAIMVRHKELEEAHDGEQNIEAPQPAESAPAGTGKGRRGRPRKSIDAATTRATAVGRSAGG